MALHVLVSGVGPAGNGDKGRMIDGSDKKTEQTGDDEDSRDDVIRAELQISLRPQTFSCPRPTSGRVVAWLPSRRCSIREATMRVARECSRDRSRCQAPQS